MSLTTVGTGASASPACAVAGTLAVDVEVPPAGAGVYDMVRGRNTCGTGTWGEDSHRTDRRSEACH